MKTRCLVLTLLISTLAFSLADKEKTHSLVKRQTPRPGNQRAFPLSRSRQFPPPEELESSEYVNSEDEEQEDRSPASPFRGRQPQRPPAEDDYSEDYSYTEAPKKTTPATQKPTARTVIFNNRFAARPRFGSQNSSTTTTTTSAPRPSTTSAFRSRATPAQSQRFDVVANILNKPPPARSSERSISVSRTSNVVAERKPVETSSDATSSRRDASSSRPRTRGRYRTRTSSTTTTTTTTTTEPPLEEYYYYYEDDEESQKNQPIATTTSTTTTTTTPKPSLPRRVSVGRRPSSSRRQTTRPVIKFDPDAIQFAPPPEEPLDVQALPSSTKKFTTTSTEAVPEVLLGGIPAHLRSKYKPRTDGRFIDFLRDPNRPRELKGFDLTDYPFYVRVPEDIDFECEDKKDGYYASIPHHCQLFHYCFAGARYDFLCANYTLYDQTTFTCRFANNVDCLSSEKYYYRNDDLWKETTTAAPQTTTPKKRRTTPKDEDYEEEYDYDEYDEEEEERRRPPKGRRNRRKNRRKPQEPRE